MVALSIIIGFKNRDIKRLKIAIDSLFNQKNKTAKLKLKEENLLLENLQHLSTNSKRN